MNLSYGFKEQAALRLADRMVNDGKKAQASALKAAPAWLNKTLVGVHDLERIVLFPFNRLAGVIAFCLAEKPAEEMSGLAA